MVSRIGAKRGCSLRHTVGVLPQALIEYERMCPHVVNAEQEHNNATHQCRLEQSSSFHGRVRIHLLGTQRRTRRIAPTGCGQVLVVFPAVPAAIKPELPGRQKIYPPGGGNTLGAWPAGLREVRRSLYFGAATP